MKNILITFLFVAQSLIAAPPASDQPIELEFKASSRVNINREQAAKEGVSISDLSKRVQAYLETHDQFTLDELKSLEITTRDGRTVKLSQVASVEVVFSKTKAKAPAEQDSFVPTAPKQSSQQELSSEDPFSEVPDMTATAPQADGVRITTKFVEITSGTEELSFDWIVPFEHAASKE